MTNVRELLEDVAYGDGPEHVISNQWLDPDQVADDTVRLAAQAAVAAYAAWQTAGRALQSVIAQALEQGRL